MSDFAGTGNGDVVLRTSVEGVDSAVSEFQRLQDAIMSLNGGAHDSLHAGGSPTNASSSAPRTTDPSAQYVNSGYTGGGAGGGRLSPDAFIPVDQRTGSFGGGSGYSGTPSAGSGLVPQNGGGSFSIHTATFVVQQANIAIASAQIVIQSATGMSAGAPGTSGAVVGGTLPPMSPSIPSGGSVPQNTPPFAMNAFWQQVAQNPTLAGFARAGLGSLPLGAVGILGAAAEVGSISMNAAYAAQLPGYQYETSQMVQAASGNYINPILAAGQTRAAVIAGEIAERRARFQPFESLPLVGGMIHGANEMGTPGFNPILRGGIRAGLSAIPIIGGALGDMADELLGPHEGLQDMERKRQLELAKADAQQRALLYAALTGTSARGSRFLEGANGLVELGSRQSLLPFGESISRMNGDFMAGSMPSEMMKFGQESTLGSFGSIVRMAQDPMMAGLRRNIGSVLGQNGINSGYVREIATQMALRGDLEGLSSIKPMLSAAGLTVDEFAQMASPVLGMQRQININQSTYTVQKNQGASIETLNRTLGATSAQYGAQIRRLQEQRAANPEFAEDYDAQIAQLQAAQSEIPRQQSFGLFGIATARAGIASAEAERYSAKARLFGGPSEYGTAVGMQRDVVGQQLQAIKDLIARGNLTQEEMLRYQSQVTSLETQQVQLQQEQIRGVAQMQFSIAQANLGIGQTQLQTGLMRGLGGVAGANAAVGITSLARESVSKAQHAVHVLRAQPGMTEDNADLKAALQALASAQQTEVGSELGQANIPNSLPLQRSLSSAQYTAQVLTSVPGAYGNVRGALQTQVKDLELEAAEIMKQRDIALANASPENREAIAFEFQKRLQGVGMQQASAMQQLSYGWESRIISEAINTGGNFGVVANRFNYRDAVGHGVVNPPFGSNGENRPFLAREADEIPSIYGSTGTPGGFYVTAVGSVGGGRGILREEMKSSGGRRGANDEITIKLELPDGTVVGRKTIPKNQLLSQEDMASYFVGSQ